MRSYNQPSLHAVVLFLRELVFIDVNLPTINPGLNEEETN